jgi:hypothetical protein
MLYYRAELQNPALSGNRVHHVDTIDDRDKYPHLMTSNSKLTQLFNRVLNEGPKQWNFIYNI